MLGYIIEFLKNCPLLEQFVLTADFLGCEEEYLGVFAEGSEPVVEQYADGGRLKQFVFRLSHRCDGHRENQENETAFYEEIGSWLENSTVMPALGKGKTAQYFEVIQSGTLADRSHGSDRYGMVCRLVYYAEKGSEQ